MIENVESLRILHQIVDHQLARDRKFRGKIQVQLESLLVVGSGNQSTMRKSYPARVDGGTSQQIDSNSILMPSYVIDNKQHRYLSTGSPNPFVPWRPDGFNQKPQSPQASHPSRKKTHRARKLPTLLCHLRGRGLMRSIDVVKLADVYSDAGSEFSYSFTRDATKSFKHTFQSRYAKQVTEEAAVMAWNRIQTPPELAGTDTTAYRSKNLYNEIIDDYSDV
jgi:hypothetical protein